MSTSTIDETAPRMHADAAGSISATVWAARTDQIAYHDRKRALDRVVAALLLLPAVPAILLLVAVVKLTSPGPGIFRQRRVGRHGAAFTMYKIRTMRCDAESASGAQWCTGPSDRRVTRIGRWIRKFHLDEFPQLFNVLRGEMSLIGPRPERPEFVEILSKTIPGYAKRHQVRPGITGLAQINLPPDSDLESVRRKLMLDLEYIETANLELDARMFLCTCVRLVGMHGQRTLGFLKVSRSVPNCGCASGNGRPADHPLTPQALGAPLASASAHRTCPQSQRDVESDSGDGRDGHVVRRPR